MVRPVAYSSMPEDRRRIYEALRSQGTLSTKEVAELVECSNPTALKVMEALPALGVVTLDADSSGHRIPLV